MHRTPSRTLAKSICWPTGVSWRAMLCMICMFMGQATCQASQSSPCAILNPTPAHTHTHLNNREAHKPSLAHLQAPIRRAVALRWSSAPTNIRQRCVRTSNCHGDKTTTTKQKTREIAKLATHESNSLICMKFLYRCRGVRVQESETLVCGAIRWPESCPVEIVLKLNTSGVHTALVYSVSFFFCPVWTLLKAMTMHCSLDFLYEWVGNNF